MTTKQTQVECAACGQLCAGDYSVHRDGFCDGPEVDICRDCGAYETPTIQTVWAMIARRRGPQTIVARIGE
jgi:hypothetical protein